MGSSTSSTIFSLLRIYLSDRTSPLRSAHPLEASPLQFQLFHSSLRHFPGRAGVAQEVPRGRRKSPSWKSGSRWSRGEESTRHALRSPTMKYFPSSCTRRTKKPSAAFVRLTASSLTCPVAASHLVSSTLLRRTNSGTSTLRSVYVCPTLLMG